MDSPDTDTPPHPETSIGAAILGVLFIPGNPGKYFQALLKVGHKSDRWINLFGAVTHYEDGETSSDMYLTRVEQLIVQEYRKHKPDAP